MIDSIQVGNIKIGRGQPLVLIAGPCVIESPAHCRQMARAIQAIAATLKMPYIFKASYDKANRSSGKSFRGPGLRDGLATLQSVKDETGLPILTDVHSLEEIAPVAAVADILQAPAFLSRQTTFLQALGGGGKAVNIKKGQFLAPDDIPNAVAKVVAGGTSNVCVTERGASFGYHNLVSDMRALPLLRECCPVIFDATHSTQMPGGLGDRSGGDRAMAEVLARAAVAVGVDGIFLEVHDRPDEALCDGPNMIALSRLPALLTTLLKIRAAAGEE
ncbi:2-dehydro-3-deoxyphosphooctonate aldolase [Planctomycetales bacterium]|nr:2-dehydro-3-deoxyphosphooctonate aldolase [Planctomycetales bacterium]